MHFRLNRFSAWACTKRSRRICVETSSSQILSDWNALQEHRLGGDTVLCVDSFREYFMVKLFDKSMGILCLLTGRGVRGEGSSCHRNLQAQSNCLGAVDHKISTFTAFTKSRMKFFRPSWHVSHILVTTNILFYSSFFVFHTHKVTNQFCQMSPCGSQLSLKFWGDLCTGLNRSAGYQQ